jgi:hypothetical protein
MITTELFLQKTLDGKRRVWAFIVMTLDQFVRELIIQASHDEPTVSDDPMLECSTSGWQSDQVYHPFAFRETNTVFTSILTSVPSSGGG